MRIRVEAFCRGIGIAIVVSFCATGPVFADELAAARALFEAGRASEAISSLEGLVKEEKRNGAAWLLLSEAQFVSGDIAAGRRSLDKAIAVAPELRQAWLNRAGLDLSERKYDRALEALRKAQQLDPTSIDNDLNIGTALLLAGDVAGADGSFQAYVQRAPADGDAHYTVASNFSMAGYLDRSVTYLRRAVQIDEKNRLRVRSDPNFGDALATPTLQSILLTDGFQPPSGSLSAARAFEVAYAGTQSTLLPAVVDVLQLSGRPVDPRIEVTPEWALIWSDIRVKIVARGPNRSEVQFTAPAGSFTPDDWQIVTEALFRDIAVQLVSRS